MGDEQTGRPEEAAEAFRRLDAASSGPPGDDEEERPSAWRRLSGQLGWLAVAMVALTIVGFGAGWIFAQTSGPSAARLLITDRVVNEPDARELDDVDIPAAGIAPSSGESDARPRCGLRDETVHPETQVATLLTGAVIIQYRPDDLGPEDIERLEGLADDVESHLLVAPNRDLGRTIVVTAWRHRLEMDEVERAALEAFIDGYRDPPMDAEPCPV